MLLDLLSSDNYVSYNVKVAQIMGLDVAVYLAELININHKAINKQKIDNNCFTVNRQYVENRTTLTLEQQIVCDKKLLDAGIIGKNVDKSDEMYIDANALLNLIAAGDAKLLDKVTKITRLADVGKNGKLTKREMEARTCKSAITTTEKELKNALTQWVDAVYARPGGFLTKRAVEIFERDLYQYTNGDLDLALKLVDIATVGGYRDFNWTKDDFEKNYAATFRRQYAPMNAPISRRRSSDTNGESF